MSTGPENDDECQQQEKRKNSASVASSNMTTNPPPLTPVSSDSEQHLPRCYPHFRGTPFYQGNQEALGFALDAIGRSSSFIAASAFLSTALLELAKTAAGCDLDSPCDKKIYGIRPSSLLTTYTIAVGILSSACMPLAGAIVDFSNHRRLVGRISSICFTLLLLPQVFISSKTWFAVAIIQILVAFIGWAQTMVTYAYLPELTTLIETLNAYTKSFTICSFGSMVIFILAVLGISTAFDMDTIQTARLAMASSFGVSAIALYLAWGVLLQQRPAARSLPPTHSIWTAGFVQVYETSIHITKHLKALKWFYISIALIDAATNSLATVAITYLTDTLQFTSQENGIAILIMLLGSIPGAVLAQWTTTQCNPINSSILATLLLTINTVVVAIVLKEPGQQIITYILGFLWGTGTGWKWTTDKLFVSSIIPQGQDAELMGMYLFAGQILTWLPPLIYTIMNEAGMDQRVGIGMLSIFFALGILALLLVGNYQSAVEVAGRMSFIDTTVTTGGGGGVVLCEAALPVQENIMETQAEATSP